MIARRHKLNAKPVRIAGRSFGSGGEATRGAELAMLEHAGEIVDLQFQVKIRLADAVNYVADYTYTETGTGRRITEDFKGYEGGASGARWRVVQQLWRRHGPTVLRVTGHDRRTRRTIVTREILPKTAVLKQEAAS